ncbi:hypothetical protein EON63_01465, partial [archaeon]
MSTTTSEDFDVDMDSSDPVTSAKRRFVDLSEYVSEAESRCFDEYITSLSTTTEMFVNRLITYCETITNEAKSHFGPDTTTEICGSVAKETFVECSDCDFYIHTAQPLTREQRLAFTRRLKSVFSDYHVGLGKKAIHVSTDSGDIDVVCSNTVEYGELTRIDKTIAADTELTYAVRALKIWAKWGIAGKVPGHCLEKMAQEVQRAYPLLPKKTSSSHGMHIFVSVLQSILDSEGTRIFGFPSRTGHTSNIRRLARTTVHVFVASRAIRGEFRTPAEIAGWVCSALADAPQDTKIGPVPSWLLSVEGRPDASSHLISIFDRHTRKAPATTTAVPLCHGEVHMHAFQLLLSSPLGQYTMAGSSSSRSEIEASRMPDHEDFKRLQALASGGSLVSHRMCHTRSLWYKGEAALEAKLIFPAIALFGSSLRHSTYDSDPFSGRFPIDHSDYFAACDEVLATDPKNTDARLVRAHLFMSRHHWSNAELELLEAIKHSPDDAYGGLHKMVCLLGCVSRWEDALPYSERCVEIEPEEPIFYYWRGICRKITMKKTRDAKALSRLCIYDLQKFLQLAAPGGRKVAQAWYEISCLRMVANQGEDMDAMLRSLEKDVVLAQQAERDQLPVFPPGTYDAKSLAEKLLEMTKMKLPKNSAEEKQFLGNASFKSQNYVQAIDYYTTALTMAPDNFKVCCNRAAAYAAMGWYTASARDADIATQLKPDWSKPYYRAAVAYLALRKLDKAIGAVKRAMQYSSSGEDINVMLKLQQEAEELLAKSSGKKVGKELPPCWPDVIFKERWAVVDIHGGGSYTSITDGLHDCLAKYGGNFSLVLRPGVHIDQINVEEDLPFSVQIIGWDGDVDNRECTTEVRGYTENSLASGPRKVFNDQYVLLSIGGEGVNLVLQNLLIVQPVGVPYTLGGACVVSMNANVTLKNCRLRTPSSPCCTVIGLQGRLLLDKCKVTGSSAAVISAKHGVAKLSLCSIKSCHKMAVEVREMGSAVLEDCLLDRCDVQA